MDCAAFERWLDEGMPSESAADARRHSEECPICERSHRAALAVESAFLDDPVSVPVGFSDRVMDRIEAEGGLRPHLPVDLEGPPLPLWIRCLTQPSVVLAGLLAACIVVWGPHLLRLGLDLYAVIGLGFADLARSGFLQRNAWALGTLGLCLVGLLPFAARALYRAGTRLIET